MKALNEKNLDPYKPYVFAIQFYGSRFGDIKLYSLRYSEFKCIVDLYTLGGYSFTWKAFPVNTPLFMLPWANIE